MWAPKPSVPCLAWHPHDECGGHHHHHVRDGKCNVQGSDDDVAHRNGASRLATRRAHTIAALFGVCLAFLFSMSMKFVFVICLLRSMGAPTSGKSNASAASHLQSSLFNRCFVMCSRNSCVTFIAQCRATWVAILAVWRERVVVQLPRQPGQTAFPSNRPRGRLVLHLVHVRNGFECRMPAAGKQECDCVASICFGE